MKVNIKYIILLRKRISTLSLAYYTPTIYLDKICCGATDDACDAMMCICVEHTRLTDTASRRPAQIHYKKPGY